MTGAFGTEGTTASVESATPVSDDQVDPLLGPNRSRDLGSTTTSRRRLVRVPHQVSNRKRQQPGVAYDLRPVDIRDDHVAETMHAQRPPHEELEIDPLHPRDIQREHIERSHQQSALVEQFLTNCGDEFLGRGVPLMLHGDALEVEERALQASAKEMRHSGDLGVLHAFGNRILYFASLL